MADLNEVKFRIFAILKENGSLGLHKFVTEYENRGGEPIPFKKFGYMTPLAFVLALSDVVKFDNEKVSLIPSAYSRFRPSEHKCIAPRKLEVGSCVTGNINSRSNRNPWARKTKAEQALYVPNGPDLTSVNLSQKPGCEVEQTVTHNGPDSTSINLGQKPGCEDQKRKEIQSDLIQKIESILSKNPQGISATNLLESFKAEIGTELDVTQLGYESLCEMVLSADQKVFKLSEGRSGEVVLKSFSQSRGKGGNQNKLRQAKYLPYEIDRRFEQIAKGHPDGIHEEEFYSTYKRLYGPLDPPEHGFESAFKMLLSCQQIEVVKMDQGFDIFPKVDTRRATSPPLSHAPVLPPMDPMFFIKDLFDELECNPLFKYAPPKIPDDWTTVEIIDAYSPTDFWIRTKENEDRTNDIMNELNEYYNEEKRRHDLPDLPFICPGLAVVAYFMDDWHRAVIKSISDDGQLEIFCVDYGTTVQNMKRSQVKKLHRLFAKDEAIAIKATLSNVQPPNGETEWSEDSFTYMYHEWAYITLRMKIIKVEADQEAPQIEAMFFSDKTAKYKNNFTQWYPDKVYNLSELLVEEKLGVWIVEPDAEELSRDRERARILQNQVEGEAQDKSSVSDLKENPSKHAVPSLTFINEFFAQFNRKSSKPVHCQKPIDLTKPIITYEPISIDLTPPPPRVRVTTSEPTESGCSSIPSIQRMLREHLKLEDSELMRRCSSGTKIIDFFDFRVGETTQKLLAVRDKGRYMVLKEKLFEITRVHPEMAQSRYERASLKSLEVLVNSCSHPELWELLQQHYRNGGICNKKDECVLVPLLDAARICTAIDPSGSYGLAYDRLQQLLQEQ